LKEGTGHAIAGLEASYAIAERYYFSGSVG
jgi:hypothetical protein